jgi:hypothetical protein
MRNAGADEICLRISMGWSRIRCGLLTDFFSRFSTETCENEKNSLPRDAPSLQPWLGRAARPIASGPGGKGRANHAAPCRVLFAYVANS